MSTKWATADERMIREWRAACASQDLAWLYAGHAGEVKRLSPPNQQRLWNALVGLMEQEYRRSPTSVERHVRHQFVAALAAATLGGRVPADLWEDIRVRALLPAYAAQRRSWLEQLTVLLCAAVARLAVDYLALPLPLPAGKDDWPLTTRATNNRFLLPGFGGLQLQEQRVKWDRRRAELFSCLRRKS